MRYGSAKSSKLHTNTSLKTDTRSIPIIRNRSDQQRYAMAQSCLKCLKYTMCVANFLTFMCGVAVMAFGAYMMVKFKMIALTPTLAQLNFPSMLLISGIIITCVSFLGFLGALKENRCLLMTFFLVLFLLMLVELTAACLMLLYDREIGKMVRSDLEKGLRDVKTKMGNSTDMTDWDMMQKMFKCCGVDNATDWGVKVPESCCISPCGDQSTGQKYWPEGCVKKLNNWFEENSLTTGISIIVLCIIEVLGMCFAMTLFCHISGSGLGYKL